MPFDAFVLNAVSKEIEKEIINKKARINKISQLNKTDLLLIFRGETLPDSLFISIHPEYARINLTKRHYVSPKSPPPFCMLLRKHLSGGSLASFRQPPLERVLYLVFNVTNEYGKPVQKTLVVEIMGRYSNLILLDEPNQEQKQVILGAMKQIPPALNRFRTVLPKHIYVPPPLQDKLHPYALNFVYFKQLITGEEGRPAPKVLLENIQGLNPFLAREISVRAGAENATLAAAPLLWQSLDEMLNIYQDGNWEPTLICDGNKIPLDYAAIKPKQQDPHSLSAFGSMSQLLDDFYEHKEKTQKRSALFHLLSNHLQQALKKTSKKEKIQSAELQKAKTADRDRLCGELLLSNLKKIPAGAKEICLENIYEEGQAIKVTLDPRLSPSQNAQRYFKKYRKARQGIKKINKQLKQTQDELKYLESVIFTLEKADLQALQEIKTELEETGLLLKSKKEAQPTPSKKKTPFKPLCFIASEGEEIYVGQNNRENEYLSLHFAGKEDLWLHVKDLPGSHVIVKSENPSQKTILEAALLTAYYSRAANSSNVAIDYTKVKHVKRHPAGKPGMVIYINHRTIFVTPEEETLQHLFKTRPR
jgi:predicted ribosome quality control (RQC) complex YloA/Tae2 family protein